MSSLAVTNTLSNGATVLASEHNTNYSDIVTYVNNRNSGSSTWDALSVLSSSLVPVVLNNSSGTQDILRVQDNGSNVFVVADGGVITMVNQSAARAYRNTSTQAISATTITKVQFNAETFDVKSEFDPVTNFRFTSTVTGKYLVSSSLKVGTGSSQTIDIYIYKNGSAFSLVENIVTSANSMVSISDILSLTATDYIEIFIQTSGVNTVVNGEGNSYVAIHKVA